MGVSRKGHHAAANGVKVANVWCCASPEFNGRKSRITMRKSVMQAKGMVQSIGPELKGKISSMEHGMDGIANGMVGTFSWTILVRMAGCSELWSVSCLLEKESYFLTLTKFTAFKHANVFVWERGVTTVSNQSFIEIEKGEPWSGNTCHG